MASVLEDHLDPNLYRDLRLVLTELITNAVGKTIRNKTVTIDFYNLMKDAVLLKTSEFGDAIIKNL